MKHDWTAEILTYWDRLRGTRAAPDRRDISPRSLGSKLPNIFVLCAEVEQEELTLSSGSHDTGLQFSASEPIAPPLLTTETRWQFRLAGTRLCTFYGRELRNTRFLSLWSEELRPWLSEQLHLSALDYRPLRLEHDGISLGEKLCRFETILLPLHEADGSIGWIGSTVALDQPLWLGNDPLISNQFAGGQPTNGYLGATKGKQPNEALRHQPPLDLSAHKPSGLKSILQALLERHLPALDEAPASGASVTKRSKAKHLHNRVHQQQIMLSDLLADGVISVQSGSQPSLSADNNEKNAVITPSGKAPVANEMPLINDSAFARTLLPQIEKVLAQFSSSTSPDVFASSTSPDVFASSTSPDVNVKDAPQSLHQRLIADGLAKPVSTTADSLSTLSDAATAPAGTVSTKANPPANRHLTLIPGGKR